MYLYISEVLDTNQSSSIELTLALLRNNLPSRKTELRVLLHSFPSWDGSLHILQSLVLNIPVLKWECNVKMKISNFSKQRHWEIKNFVNQHTSALWKKGPSMWLTCCLLGWITACCMISVITFIFDFFIQDKCSLGCMVVAMDQLWD